MNLQAIFMNKLRIKKGDTVKVLSGKDKGKTGKVLEVIPKIQKVVVENVNMHTRFERSKKAGQPGKKVIFSSPLAVSKVQIIDSSSGNPSRVGYSILENGSKQRIAKASGKAI
jgi:large subunit ribosomal protein L24